MEREFFSFFYDYLAAVNFYPHSSTSGFAVCVWNGGRVEERERDSLLFSIIIAARYYNPNGRFVNISPSNICGVPQII